MTWLDQAPTWLEFIVMVALANAIGLAAMSVARHWSYRLGVTTATLIALQQSAKPRSPSYADDLYRQLGSIEDLRNRRWQTSTSSAPDEIWVALLVLSAGVLVVLSLALTDRPETHIVLMFTAATALGTLFWVAAVLEYPFCGHTGIGPGELLDILRAHLLS